MGVELAVCVIGGGVVGAGAALALARRGAEVTLLEAESELALCASGTNSGILHTGFDSPPGTLETRLILRSALLRREMLDALGVPVLHAGALMRPGDERERAAAVELTAGAHANGVEVELSADGSLMVPGEWVTDPVAFTLALAAAAERAGARVRCGTRVDSVRRERETLVLTAGAEPVARCRVAVNCAGLHADELARAAGDDSFRIVPRKGEFFVFEPPAEPLEQVLLPVPSARTKGVLVFPTTDGKVVAGPTAHDQDDKRDWSVRPQALAEVRAKAARLLPELGAREPIGSYVGLRPAGGNGVNYLIEPSPACPALLNVAAIRSTGLSAALGIAELVAAEVGTMGVTLAEQAPLEPGDPPALEGPWWQRSARHWAERSA